MIGNYNSWNLKAKDFEFYQKNKFKIISEITENDYQHKKFSNKIFLYYDFIIPILYKKLNSILNKNFDQKFWNILIGPWLFLFLEFYYSKYLIYKKIKKKKNFSILKNQQIIIENFDQFYEFSQKRDYNDYIFSQIHDYFQKKKTTYIKNKKGNNEHHVTYKNKIGTKEKILEFLSNFKQKDMYNENIVNFNLDLDLNNLFELSNSSRKMVINYFKKIPNLSLKKNIFFSQRNESLYEKLKKKDTFCNLLNKTILKNLPKSYLEYFSFYENFYKQFTKINDQKFLVRSPVETAEKSRFLLAFLSLKKNKLLCFQEGGVGKPDCQKYYTKYYSKFCDQFYVWSKNSDNFSKSFYCTKTFWIKKYPINQKKTLITLGSVKPYFFSFYSSNSYKFGFSQINLITNFLNLYKKNFDLNEVILKLHNDNGFEEKDYFKKRFPKLRIQDRVGNPYIYSTLSESEIKIFTNDYTANMQSLLINHPTLFLWDDKIKPNNSNYSKIYKDLFKNKILFYSSKECFQHYTDIKKDPLEWWMSNNVQKIKNNYLETFCRYSDNISDRFKKEIFKKIY